MTDLLVQITSTKQALHTTVTCYGIKSVMEHILLFIYLAPQCGSMM